MNSRHSIVRWLLPGLFALIALSCSVPALAQDGGSDGEPETVAATDEQARLNDRGVRAIGKGDYVKASSLLEEALYLDKLDVTYWGANSNGQLGINNRNITSSNLPLGVHCP